MKNYKNLIEFIPIFGCLRLLITSTSFIKSAVFFLCKRDYFPYYFIATSCPNHFPAKTYPYPYFYLIITPSPTKLPISNSFQSIRKLCPIPTFFKSFSKNYSEINIYTIIRNTRFRFLFSLWFPQRSFYFLIIFIARTART